MKTTFTLRALTALALLALAILIDQPPAFAQGTAFTYQGRLDSGGSPVNGSNDLTFTLYNAVSAGATVGTSNTVNDLLISNGLFTVTLDFGAGAFDGNPRWLQIAARPGVSTGAYTNLAPRQPITPSPYAIFAGGAAAAGLTGTLPSAALAGPYSGAVNYSNAANSFAGNGGRLTNLNTTNFVGTVADARLSANVALRSGGNTFNGTQVITNGNVGIGIANPVATLDVRGPSTSVGGIALGDYDITNSRYIGIINPGQPANISAGLGFSGVEFGGPAGNPTSGMLAFHTHSFGASSSEKMRIDKSGNVGIGTTTPAARLDVVGLGNFSGGLQVDGIIRVNNGSAPPINSISGGAGSRLVLYPGDATYPPHGFGITGNTLWSVVPAPNRFVWYGGVNEVMRLTGAGFLTVAGEVTTTAVNITSDRNAKEQFKPVNAREVLAKVVGLPISEWQYKSQGDARHIGPMAQDFREAFALGRDDKHITSVDADGVALAAIQGLNEKLEERTAEVEALKKSVAELREIVNRLAAPAQAAGH